MLRRPCGRAHIAARQELFGRMLTNEGLQPRLQRLLNELRAYGRLVAELTSIDDGFQRLYLRVRTLEAFCGLQESLAELKGEGELLSAVADTWPRHPTLQADMIEVRRILKKTQTAVLSSSGKLWLAPGREAVSLREKLLECAAGLGIEVISDIRSRAETPYASIAEAMVACYSSEFAAVHEILQKYAEMDLREVTGYAHELEFYLGVYQLVQQAKEVGISICFAKTADTPSYQAEGLCDVSLLQKEITPVPNDAYFTAEERFFFLTGANGGGKTTYARAVGINLLLFLSGCPVFARSACIYPFSGLRTHFAADERFETIGRLDEEKARVEIMCNDSERPFLIFNETFSGTDDQKGYALMLELSDEIRRLGSSGLFVTHFHQIEGTDNPLLYAEVDETNCNARTYRIRRSGAKGMSLAADILKKYRLDPVSLQERLGER